MKLLEIILLAAVAGFILYQLYAVLGRRVGRQPGDAAPAEGADMDPAAEPARPDRTHYDVEGLDEVTARDPGFDPGRFLDGARGAFEMIVRAYAEGDLAALRDLVAPAALAGFEAGIAARKAEGRTEAVEFQHQPRADIEKAEMRGDVAQVQVRFLAEFRSRTKGPEGEAVDDRRTAELWTFERDVNSRDPNWTLVRVDAAPV